MIRTVCTLVLGLLLLPLTAAADTCVVRVNALDVVIDEATFQQNGLDTSRRERLVDWPRRSLSQVTGAVPSCQSNTVLVFLAELSELHRTDGYCLEYGDPEVGYLLIPGERNYRGRCKQTRCERVRGAALDIAALTDGITTIFGTPPDVEEIARSESLGAMAVSGSTSFLQRRLNNAGTAAVLGTLATPALATASAVTLVAVGGGVFLCNR